MLEQQNSEERERELDDWAKLFSLADKRLGFKGDHMPQDSYLWTFESRLSRICPGAYVGNALNLAFHDFLRGAESFVYAPLTLCRVRCICWLDVAPWQSSHFEAIRLLISLGM